MTTEQLAIVVPALVAIVTVWIIARTQAKINRQTLGAQRTLAQQERARAAYEDMMHMVRWVMELVNATKPVWRKPVRSSRSSPKWSAFGRPRRESTFMAVQRSKPSSG